MIPYMVCKYDYRESAKEYDYQIDHWYILQAQDSELVDTDEWVEQVQWFTKGEATLIMKDDPKLLHLIDVCMI